MSHRILTGHISQETNSFNKIPTTLEHFLASGLLRGDEVPAALRGTRTTVGAMFEAAEKFNWALSHPLIARANPGGPLTKETFEQIADWFLAGAKGCHGALFELHGAMVAEGYEDPEGEILARLRAVLGPGVPIIATLDLHANVTEKMAANASALIAVRTYPHIDYYERAWQGAELLDRALRGEINPRTVIAKRPMLFGLDGGRTQVGPMCELINRGNELEASGKALVVSVCAGFELSDIYDVGPSVTVTADGDTAAAQRIAEDFMDYAWETREFLSAPWAAANAAEAAEYAKAGELHADKPLVLADNSDNPGGGAYGDATELLRAMIAADLQNAAFHAIFDPAAVQAGIAIGVGNTGRIVLGGKHDPEAGGGPLEVEGQIVSITDGRFRCYGPSFLGGGIWNSFGPSLMLRVGGIEIVVISRNGQGADLAQLTALGIDPLHCATIALKSSHHFRAAFEPIAREVLMVDGGGMLGSAAMSKLVYRRVRRPIWPLDEVQEPKLRKIR
ncbi:MAG: M81 family metallopeptidase [Mesorhizobium sp.]|uniref:M81 family metallopeptidase n=1 Tax=unclassified Mesorhizobium TaxID=325217 RepID=UPI000FCC6F4A|nr:MULTISPECIES: M81 family metallopeptidase [unclassified Mesorhizobium]RUW80938.1 M81 family peptidase [Mesorhizobium sp. M1E.F.Ca.ET.063.01.1.1]TIW10373.1 MAG: M81 family metallopeptidase [Mesorhizobium sp.]